jgi:hypothetical protein
MLEKLHVDHIRFTPNIDVIRRSSRHGTLNFLQDGMHEHLGIFNFTQKMACLYRIPVILWGENGMLDTVGGQHSMDDLADMSQASVKEQSFGGLTISEYLKGNKEGLTEEDFEYATYDESVAKDIGLRGIYLGNYINWDNIPQTKLMIDRFDFNTGQMDRTFNLYENTEVYANGAVHDWMRYLKYGFGRATDHASQLIRNGWLTRPEGAWLVNRFDNVKVEDKWNEYLNWIGLTEKDLEPAIERLRKWSGVWEDRTPEERPKRLPYKVNPMKPREGRQIL